MISKIYFPPVIISRTIGAATIIKTAGTIKKSIGNKILVAAVAPAFSTSADFFCLISIDKFFKMGPIFAPTESAAIKVAQKEEMGIISTLQARFLKPSALDAPIFISFRTILNSSVKAEGLAF